MLETEHEIAIRKEPEKTGRKKIFDFRENPARLIELGSALSAKLRKMRFLSRLLPHEKKYLKG